jgi:hypothetical protein
VVLEVVCEHADLPRLRRARPPHPEFLRRKLKDASVSRIQIERPAKKANIAIHTARPGIVIGKKGEDIEKLAQRLRSCSACRCTTCGST